MLRSILGHTSQKRCSSYLQQQSTKTKSITQSQLWMIQQHQHQQQHQRLFSGAQCLQYERSRKKDKSPSFTNKKNSTFKNRRFINLDGAEDRPNRHLYTLPRDVYGTSDRVTQLLKFEGIDEAYDLLTHIPLELQSTVAWNQLLNHCAKEKRAGLAENIFSQMRKRGIEPSERTFAHIITAFIGSNSPTACERAESWIDKMKSYGIQPTTYHYNSLLNVYSKAEQYNHVVAKIRQMMRDDGLLPYPDKVTLSIALQVVPLLVNNPNKEIKRIWRYMMDCLKDDYGYQETNTSHYNNSTSQPSLLQAKVNQLESNDLTFRNDRQMIRDQEKSIAAAKYHRQPLEVDDTLVVTFIRALGRSNRKLTSVKRTDNGGDNNSSNNNNSDKKDMEHKRLAIDMMDQLYGLRPSHPLTTTTKTTINSFKCFGLAPGVTVLDAIVRYWGAFVEYELGEAYFDLAVQKFPNLEPDARAYDAYAWMQSNTRRKNFNKKNTTGPTQ